ncbi:MAG: transglutaminase-like domain-containing protein [Dehalococcoidia bacterium]|nr:transglutaminase-like domain-containing protein [Dehalococcoidia bacterium]
MAQVSVLSQFAEVTDRPDYQIDVARAAMLLAAAEYPQLNVERELFAFQRLAGAISSKFLDDNDPLYCVNVISEHLFDDMGFRGDADNYYDPRNSYLNQVIERRTGIPITLAVVYMEVGRRLKVPLLGIGMPGHFLVRHREIENIYIDAFGGGILLSEEECRDIIGELARGDLDWSPDLLKPVSNREIIARMIRNLKAIYMADEDFVRALTVSEFALALDPHSAMDRRDRGIVHYQLGHSAEALDDLVYYLDLSPSGPDVEGVHALVAELRLFLDD